LGAERKKPPSLVILSPALVILSEAKDLGPPSGVDSAKDLGFRFRINSGKELEIWKSKILRFAQNDKNLFWRFFGNSS
jgi:hypothetical protein